MTSDIRVFISHRRNNGKAIPEAKQLKITLEKQYGFSVFLDELNLATGDLWAQRIFDEVHRADILIVLLQHETYKSNWIQREVDMARGIFLPIMPLVIDNSIPKTALKRAVERLDLAHIQQGHFTGTSVEFDALAEKIRERVVKTKQDQLDWGKARQSRWRPMKAVDALSVVHFPLNDYPNPCQIHLATGDLTSLSSRAGRAFDVIVNSENDHMQMARIFEGDRLSSIIRRKGALINRTILQDDTVQRELDIQVVYNPDYYRPIERHSVIPTYGGHPKSELAQQTGARYIFHVTTVGVDGMGISSGTIEALVDTEKRMENAVHSALRMAIDIDRSQGQIFPPSMFEGNSDCDNGALHIFGKTTPQWDRMTADLKQYDPIISIVFPLFGTGHAGLEVSNVITWMLRAFTTFPKYRHNHAADLHIRDIYLCVHSIEYVDLAKTAMQNMLP